MTQWRKSLRGRLVFSMLFVFFLGLGGALTLHRDAGPIPKPHQDILVLVPFSLGAMVLIWLVSAWSLRHLASASREATNVGPCSPAVRISTTKLPGEVRPLVQAVNGALDRLAEAYELERRFVAGAAHELRTPLAVLNLRVQQRARLDGNPDWRGIETDLANLNRLVEQLLDLARKQRAHLVSNISAANLSRIAREAAATVIALVEEAGRELEVDLPRSLPVCGRSDDLRDMVRNLLDNALAHGSGTISLTGETSSASGRHEVWITVGDEGGGVPFALREAVFDRFQRATAESPGHGLGLAIVREVASAHHGSVEFLPDAACRVRVTLPATEAGN